MASSSSNPHVTLQAGEEYPYPYPSDLSAASCFVSVKLNGRDKYRAWKTQMLCLLKSHRLSGFIDGTFVSPDEASSSVSGKEKVDDHQTHHSLWTRSDALVKGWILGSLTEETVVYVLDRLTSKLHQQTDADFSAKVVWDELKKMYGPPEVTPPALVPPHWQSPPSSAFVESQTSSDGEEQEKRIARYHKYIYEATLRQNLEAVDELMAKVDVTVLDQLSNNGNTALHVAVNNPKFLEKLLERVPENTQLLNERNSDGSTLLHVAAIVDNPKAADILLNRSRSLLFSKDNNGHTPLFISLSNMHYETAECLLGHLHMHEERFLFSGTSGEELLVALISAKGFDAAVSMLRYHPGRGTHSDAVLMSVVQNYPCENMWEKFIDIDLLLGEEVLETVTKYMVDRCVPVCGSWVERILNSFLSGIFWIILVFPRILQILGYLFNKTKLLAHYDGRYLIDIVCENIIRDKNFSTYHNYYTNPIFEATRLNLPEVVQSIVSIFPNAISSANQDGHNIVQYAVISRSEKVYNLIYQMTEHKNVYRTIRDSSDNNLLHLAGRLAPAHKLKLISGAALQIQRELQWFKEVERFVCPLNIMQKNCFGETPQMVFTREHKDLVIEGEQWLKATAESYTITAALIITIVFAAAITVPGGNKDTGIPIFMNKTVFGIFAISDAISLFRAVTSLLMFLSVLTARFAEQDFLFKLPTKLIIGLATLFISTTAMIVAFAATLYLVFGQSNSRILIPIAVLTCLPITCFVTLQFPLVLDLVSATYGRSIFGKKNDDLFY